MKLFGIVDDYRRYRAEGNSTAVRVLLSQGFWAICEYRIAHAAINSRNRLTRKFFSKFFVLSQKLVQIVTAIHIPHTVKIGRGLYIPHFGPVLIGEKVTIGDYCTIHPGCVLGSAGRNEKRGAPRLGSRVFIGVNAVIVGNVGVGDEAAIGAGAVVTKDVPARATVVGNPGTVVSLRGSADLIAVPGHSAERVFRHTGERLGGTPARTTA